MQIGSPRNEEGEFTKGRAVFITGTSDEGLSPTRRHNQSVSSELVVHKPPDVPLKVSLSSRKLDSVINKKESSLEKFSKVKSKLQGLAEDQK